MSSSSSSSPSPSPSSSIGSQRKRKRSESPVVDSDSESDVVPAALSAGSDHPALSHADRRKQKKRARLQEEANVTKSLSKTRNKTDVPPSAAARQNSVWVGNLSFKTTPEALKTFFNEVGEVTRINMPVKPGGKEIRGFAYVDFTTSDAKTLAIARSETAFLGRRLLIKDGEDFKGRPGAESSAPLKGLTKFAQKILRLQKQPPGPTLFIGNLGFETTEESIRELFEAHRGSKKKAKDKDGEVDGGAGKGVETQDWIRKVRMGTFEDSGRCKGWAFIDFAKAEDATTVLTNPQNHRLNGREIVMEYASPEAVRRGGGATAKTNSKGGEQKMGITNVRDRLPRTTPASASGRKRAAMMQKRVKPGAALALAKRESAAIVPSQGRKTKF